MPLNPSGLGGFFLPKIRVEDGLVAWGYRRLRRAFDISAKRERNLIDFDFFVKTAGGILASRCNADSNDSNVVDIKRLLECIFDSVLSFSSPQMGILNNSAPSFGGASCSEPYFQFCVSCVTSSHSFTLKHTQSSHVTLWAR